MSFKPNLAVYENSPFGKGIEAPMLSLQTVGKKCDHVGPTRDCENEIFDGAGVPMES